MIDLTELERNLEQVLESETRESFALWLYQNRGLKPYLIEALMNPLWLYHEIGDAYTMDGKPDMWRIAYYPIFANGKTNEVYVEPRALVEKPIQGGTDFREIPLRYLTKTN